ncbi:haloacid dehalogenase superfamily, subfamily IA, variant 3 with third motif having DD or ED [Poseidonocella pacifica]|uniref:Haloacid dehalogenase superfamily, subfamily IA, variant 3 with third motif having DD or ED n=1 Tax=Poseidonocella pacifica TaxID=871651 RepID=A0A1I0VHP1_9RHOB|nr:HAD family phosphatase [Poseidonocella pacifica]SFA75831.1 haloacid dehalogenase superfamily, subfamily IA, variant 3 with third motif having DD or ED [Poseidonocella pacifica]
MAEDRALLFDLDGTMLDTDPIHMAVFTDMMAPYGIEVDEQFYMRHVHGRLNIDFFREFLPDQPDLQGLSEEKEAEFRRRLPRPYPPMPGLKSFLEARMNEGWRMGVVTNAMRPNAEAMLDAIGERARFEVVVIGEECPRGKPHPDPYRIGAEQLGVKPHRAIAFEDSPSGLRAARSAGCRVIGLTSSLAPDRLREAGAHHVISDFDDPALPEILTQFKGAAA